jgi:hypothetical protein
VEHLGDPLLDPSGRPGQILTGEQTVRTSKSGRRRDDISGVTHGP